MNDMIPMLTFRLDQHRYALPISAVQEVAMMVAITPQPDAPAEWLGLVNRHGSALPLLDLRRVFKLPAPAPDLDTFFIVANHGDICLGLVVDEVYQVIYVDAKTIRSLPQHQPWISAVIQTSNELIQVIALQALLDTYMRDGSR